MFSFLNYEYLIKIFNDLYILQNYIWCNIFNNTLELIFVRNIKYTHILTKYKPPIVKQF